jgi:ferredoxin/flavodoxin
MHTTIYYFTGTGNSLKIAKELSEKITDSSLVEINKKLMDSGTKPASGKIGIVFPVYVDGLPLIVERFVNDLNIDKDTYIFAIANFGGAAGMSLYQMENLLAGKGNVLSAAFEILMPDNTQIMFPPLAPDEQEECLKSALGQITEIAHAINREKADVSCIEPLRKKGKSWIRPKFEPFKMEKEFWCNEKCDSCGICKKVCPVDNITMNKGRPSWHGKCEQCLACMQWCPRESIQFGKRTAEWGRYHNPYIKLQELFRGF